MPPPLHTHLYSHLIPILFPTCFILLSPTQTYNLMSERWFTHASPTLFNAGTCRPQLSSCFLVCMKEDSIEVSPQDSHGKVWDKHTISILPSCLEGGLKTYEPGSLEENRVYPRQWPHFVLKVTSFARKIPQQVGSLGVIVYQHEMHMFSSKNLKTGFCGFVIAGYLRHSEDLCQHLKVCRGDWTGSPLYQGIRKLHCRGECSIRHSTSVYISANYTFGIMSAVIPCSQFQSKHYP